LLQESPSNMAYNALKASKYIHNWMLLLFYA
jgi:hypothetical protein